MNRSKGDDSIDTQRYRAGNRTITPPVARLLVLGDTGEVCDANLPPQRQDRLGGDLLGHS